MWFKLKSDSKFKFPEDLVSGFTSSVSTIPDALAAAVIAGVNPINGMYSAFIAPLIASWTTSSVFMRISTTGALALAANGVVHHVSQSEKLSYIVLITFLAGVIQLAMGIFRLGWIVNFISNSVMRGFLTAISILIILGQMPEVSGNYNSKATNKLIKTIDILSAPELFNWFSVGATLFTIICIILFKKTRLKHLAFMLALILGTVVIHLIPDTHIKLVGDENRITSGLPPFSIPQFDHLFKVLLSAMTIALIGFLESSGVSHLKPNPNGKYPNNSEDLRGQGLANLSCSLFSGIPVGGSMSQTSILIDAGARSRWANFLSGFILLILLLLLGGLIEKLPYACFAAILIVAAVESINEEEIVTILETSKHSAFTMIVAFAFTIALPLHLAVCACLVLTGFLHLIHKPNHVVIKSLEKINGQYQEVSAPEVLPSNSKLLLTPYGVLVFDGAYEFENKLPEIQNATNTTVILALRGRKELGSSFISVLHSFALALENSNNRFIVIEVSKNVYHQLKSTGLIHIIGQEDVIQVLEGKESVGKKYYLEEEVKMLEGRIQ